MATAQSYEFEMLTSEPIEMVVNEFPCDLDAEIAQIILDSHISCMTINRRTKSFIYKQNDQIATDMFNKDPGDHTERLYTKDKNPSEFAAGEKILKIHKLTGKSLDEKNTALTQILKMLNVPEEDIPNRIYDTAATEVDPVTGEVKRILDKTKAKAALQKLIDYFDEWKVDISLRFVNCLVLSSDPQAYTRNYFYVQDHPDAMSIAEKVKSPEFAKIVAALKSSGPAPKPINTRLVIYYGAPGAGKTYKATELTSKQIPCASDMLPADIVQNFAFTDGKPNFDASDICKAMESGEQILLDEINLLPYPTLRFLQTITDNKESIDYKGRNIKIHPNFKIYGTMNLNVDGHPQPIPQPLADRAAEIIEFKLTAEDLLRALE